MTASGYKACIRCGRVRQSNGTAKLCRDCREVDPLFPYDNEENK